jgi:hypothetical protein
LLPNYGGVVEGGKKIYPAKVKPMHLDKPQIVLLQRAVNSIRGCILLDVSIVDGVIICPAIMSRVSTV